LTILFYFIYFFLFSVKPFSKTSFRIQKPFSAFPKPCKKVSNLAPSVTPNHSLLPVNQSHHHNQKKSKKNLNFRQQFQNIKKPPPQLNPPINFPNFTPAKLTQLPPPFPPIFPPFQHPFTQKGLQCRPQQQQQPQQPLKSTPKP